MKIGADPVQKALAHFDRSATPVDEHRALRFDRLIASPHDAVEQNDLQQRHPANRNPALQAGAIKFGLEASGVGKELRHRNDVIAAVLVDRDVNLKQRHVQATLDRVSFALRALKSGCHFAFQGLEQLGIDWKSLADEIPICAVNDPPVREADLDGYDLPGQFRILKQIIEGAQRLLAQRRLVRQFLQVGPVEAVDVGGGCGSAIANHMRFDRCGHKAAKHHHSGSDDDAGHEGELLEEAQAVPPAPHVRHAIDSFVAIAQRFSSRRDEESLQVGGIPHKHWCDSGQIWFNRNGDWCKITNELDYSLPNE